MKLFRVVLKHKPPHCRVHRFIKGFVLAKDEETEVYVEIDGTDTLKATPKTILGVRESGSTLRFMIPIALLSENKTEFCGSTRLFERPLGVYEAIAKENGFEFKKCENGEYSCDMTDMFSGHCDGKTVDLK